MEAQEFLTASFDDMVFEGKNKEYGAYELRKNYSRFLMLALFIGLGCYIVGFTSPYIISMFEKAEGAAAKKKITYTELSEPPPIDKNVPPPPPPNIPPPPPKTIKFTPPVIKPDEEVKPEDVPPPVEELQKTDPGPTNETDPNANVNFNDAPVNPVVEEKEKPLMYVEQMPTFPGGDKARIAFLQKNVKYPTAARENNISGKVVVKFVVNKDGSISDLEVLRPVGGGCTEEALRVIKMMPKWNPGIQNGNPTAVYFNLPIEFKLGEE